jgi:hypothetical protein
VPAPAVFVTSLELLISLTLAGVSIILQDHPDMSIKVASCLFHARQAEQARHKLAGKFAIN